MSYILEHKESCQKEPCSQINFFLKKFCLPFIAKRCVADEVVPKAASKSIDLKTKKVVTQHIFKIDTAHKSLQTIDVLIIISRNMNGWMTTKVWINI